MRLPRLFKPGAETRPKRPPLRRGIAPCPRSRFASHPLFATLALALAFLPLTAAVRTSPHAEEQPVHRHEPGHAHEHDHDEEHLVRLSASQLELVGIRVVAAQPGRLAMTLNLPGQIAINADRLAHVVPRVAGVVAEVRKTLGDSVEAGEVMAVIDSRELAESRAAYLAACKQAELASATFRRKEILWKEEIIPKQVYQEAKLALAVARVEEHTVEQKLLAMGISLQQLHVLRREPLESLHPHEELSRYEIAAPFAGTILERHITLGEAVQPDAPIFLLGDLSTVWVDLNVYPKDLPRVRSGQTVTIGIGDEGPDTRGKIIHVQPLINEETRRTFARAEIDNRDGRWQPGLFVTGRLETGSVEVPVRVARTALQSIKSHEFAGTGFEPAHAGPGQTVKGLLQTVVFVREDEGFEPRPVVIGRGDDRYVEVVGGLEPGELYAETGSFILKAELEKGEATHEH